MKKLFAVLLVAACQTPEIQRIDEDVVSSDLDFVRDGATTREEVLLRLGHPSGQFEGERILTYLLILDADGALHVTRPRRGSEDTEFMEWRQSTYNLVLVFGLDDVVEKHSLVVAK